VELEKWWRDVLATPDKRDPTETPRTSYRLLFVGEARQIIRR